MMIEDVLGWIERQPDQAGWQVQQWRAALDAAGPWRGLVGDAAHWPALEAVRPRSDRAALARLLVDVAGAPLAVRWLASADDALRHAAEGWWHDNLDWLIGSPAWAGLSVAQRRRIIDRRVARVAHTLGQQRQVRQQLAAHGMRLQRIDDASAAGNDHVARRRMAADAGRQYRPDARERELIARLLEWFPRDEYTIAPLPAIIVSHETLPVPLRHPATTPAAGDGDDTARWRMRLDGVLGTYRPTDQTIILYGRAIAWYARHRRPAGSDVALVRAVVLLHQVAQWLAHTYTRPGWCAWPAAHVPGGSARGRRLWADVASSWVVGDVGGAVRQCFEQLMLDQPERTGFEDVVLPRARVVASLDRLRLNPDDWAESVIGPITEDEPAVPQLLPMAAAAVVDRVGAEYRWVARGGGLAGFWMMRKPVTNAMWYQAMRAGACEEPAGGLGEASHPVVGVTLVMARQYAGWIGGRLPYDEEWQWAAQGDDRRKWPWGNQPPDTTRANCRVVADRPADPFSWPALTPVGSFPAGASPFGLLDMAGNVWEWCEGSGSRVLRGASWIDNLESALNASYRHASKPTNRNVSAGFRCVLVDDASTTGK